MTVSPTLYRRITFVALVALCAIVVTGAAVRLTGSGLGCSDWPTCERGEFVASLDFHPMIEFINRLITGVVSVAVIVAVLASLVRRPRRRDLTMWSLGLVFGVIAQIVIGAVVTLSDLRYSVVAGHFLVSMVLVWAAVVLLERAGWADDEPREPGPARVPARWLLGLCTLVLLTGPVVTSAGPHAGDADVERLPLDLGWAARIHSLSVWCFIAAIVWTGWRTATRHDAIGRRRMTDLLVAAVAQAGIGYAQYFTGVPAILVGIHVAGATLVWVMTIRASLALSTRPMDRTHAVVPATPSTSSAVAL